MDLTSYIIPYPYKAYTKHNRGMKDFDSYLATITKWVANNTGLTDINSFIESAFIYVENSDQNNNIKTWLINHLDKLRPIYDFSGLAFGIEINEETESIGIRFPMCIDDEDKQLYPFYDEDIFKNMDTIDKLEWMYSYCIFIPIRIMFEDIFVDGSQSHKFSHIKRNVDAMIYLSQYLENAKFPPNDDVYYFIQFNTKSSCFYLKRDLDKSPKIRY